MTVEEAVRDSLATADAVLVVASAARVEEAVRGVRAADAAFVLLLIDSSIPELERAMLVGAVGPLAKELAPGARLAAIDVAPGASAGDVAAAARFLATAISTTGQVLRVEAEA